jgi:hypothetical protein
MASNLVDVTVGEGKEAKFEGIARRPLRRELWLVSEPEGWVMRRPPGEEASPGEQWASRRAG